MRGIYLGLGSNLGDRLENLRRAIAEMPPKVMPLELSPVYETEPWDYLEQPAFLNQVIEVETSLSPLELLVYLKRIEKKLGRRATFRNGPREIDLDILLYGDTILEKDGLVIPHPRMHERAFVLRPLADLAPGSYHPILGRTIQSLLDSVEQSGVRLFI